VALIHKKEELDHMDRGKPAKKKGNLASDPGSLQRGKREKERIRTRKRGD